MQEFTIKYTFGDNGDFIGHTFSGSKRISGADILEVTLRTSNSAEVILRSNMAINGCSKELIDATIDAIKASALDGCLHDWTQSSKS